MAEESERISRFRREREPRLRVDLWVGKTWKFSLFSLALIEEKKNCCEGHCKCFNRARSREDSTVQAFPLFCLKSCHFAVNGGNFFAISFGSLCWCSYFWTLFKSFDFILCLFLLLFVGFSLQIQKRVKRPCAERMWKCVSEKNRWKTERKNKDWKLLQVLGVEPKRTSSTWGPRTLLMLMFPAERRNYVS